MDQKDDETLIVKLINNKQVSITRESIVGYCHYSKHKGALTKSLLKKHECLKKQCHFFKKNKDNPYVDRVIQNKKNQMEAKKTKKDAKKTAKQQEMQQERKLEALKNNVQEIADISGYDIRIISIKESSQKGHYTIFYISREARNDWNKYMELLIKLSCISTGHYELRHIKDINGNYAVY